MKKFVQIVNSTAYWIFEAEELPPYPNPEDFLDITGRDDVQEGYTYNKETGEFSPPVLSENPTVPEIPVDPIDPSLPPTNEVISKIDELKAQLAGDNLTLFESIVDSYEKTASENLATLESTAAVFEEVQFLKSELTEIKTLIQTLTNPPTE